LTDPLDEESDTSEESDDDDDDSDSSSGSEGIEVISAEDSDDEEDARRLAHNERLRNQTATLLAAPSTPTVTAKSTSPEKGPCEQGDRMHPHLALTLLCLYYRSSDALGLALTG
jgi:hypothetical protein